MNTQAFRWVHMIGTAMLLSCAEAMACIPIMADPEEDAAVASGISVGRIESRHDFPTTAVVGTSVWVITAPATLKGIMPRHLIVPLRCGDADVTVGDPVIVVQLGRQLITRPAGGEYEALLREALRQQKRDSMIVAP